MGFFYFDESIQGRAGFIIGAFVYSEADLTPSVFEAIATAGWQPGVDEFKSGARMDGRPAHANAREALRGLLQSLRVGLVVVPAYGRDDLGAEAPAGLEKIIRANELTASGHRVYFDEGITVESNPVGNFGARIGVPCEIFLGQNSKLVGGIQVADLAAHSMGVMFLSTWDTSKKRLRRERIQGMTPISTSSLASSSGPHYGTPSSRRPNQSPARRTRSVT